MRADHRMTTSGSSGSPPTAADVPTGLEAPHGGVFTPPGATRPRRPTRTHGTLLPGASYARAVREAGLDFDHDVPADLAVGNDRQLWRLDDDTWHSEPLRPTE